MADAVRPEVQEIVQRVYPLLCDRTLPKVVALRVAHESLREAAAELGEHEEEWADLALRLMLEYERAA